MLPILSLYLLSLKGFTTPWLVLYFSLPATLFILNALLTQLYCKLLTRRAVIFIGALIFAASILLVGTLLGPVNNPAVILLGLCLNSFGGAMIVVPVYPEMVSSIERQLGISGNELNSVTAGYFNSCIGIGEAIGPITASLLTSFGFRHSQYVVGFLSAVFCIAYFFYNGMFTMFIKQEDDDYVRVKQTD
jgi:MFS family permease